MHLRGTDWILKLLYHEIACVNHWSESNNMRDLQFIKDGKKRVQESKSIFLIQLTHGN